MQIRRRDLRNSAWRGLLGVTAIVAATLLPPKARAQFSRFQNYTEDQGLDGLAVTSFAQNKAGEILIGTEGGIYQYDGTRVMSYNATGLPSASLIQQIAFDANDRLWVVTLDHAYVRDGAAFRPIDTGHHALEDGSYHLLAFNNGSAVLDAGGALLRVSFDASGIGLPSPLFDTATISRLPELGHAGFVVSDGDDGLLIGCGSTLCLSRNGQVTRLGREAGLPDDDWSIALRAPDGVLWVRSLSHLAWRRPGQTSFQVVEVPEHVGSYFAGHLHQLDLVSDGRGGILTEGGGDLIEFTGGGWTQYKHHLGGLPSNAIHGLLVDHEGSLWVGSEGGGAFRSLGFGTWQHWTVDDGLPSDTVWSMTRLPSGQFWVATDQGSVTLGSRPARIAGSDYALAASRAGQLWLAPFGGALLRLKAQGQIVERMTFAPTVLMAVVDSQNQLWLETREGVFLIQDADAAIADIRPKLMLPYGKMNIVTDPSGGIWATGRFGVFKLGLDGAFHLVVAPAAFATQPLELVFTPDGTIWLGTKGTGIQRFRMTGGQMLALPGIRAPTISSDSILFIHRDRSDRIWVGTGQGVDMFDGRNWRRFNSSQGPISNDMDQESVYEDVDGSMWFGTSHGLSHLLVPDQAPTQTRLHPGLISVAFGERALPLSSKITAKWSAAPLIIRFADFDYAQGAITFRYRLRGLDESWTETVAREVRYANVPFGKFRFELVAVSRTKGISSAAIGFTVRISAPWWRQWWFFGLCAGCLVLCFIGAWQGRVRLLLQRQRRLEETVNLRTAEIEQARRQLEDRSLLEQGRLHEEQRRLEEMVEARTAEIEQARSDLQRIAMLDVLTGLPNRRAIMNALADAVALAHRSGQPLAAFLCDIDHFKKINDGFGHLAGDAVLREFGSRLGCIVVQPEIAGRYGGEEFLVILPGETDTIRCRALDIHSAMSDMPFLFAEELRRVTFSAGVALLRSDDSPITLIARADAALYAAKRNGRSQVVFETAHDAKLDTISASSQDAQFDSTRTGQPVQAAAVSLEADLRAALRDGQFTLHYQPVVRLDTDVVTSCEALLRWHSPSRGNVAPVDFIPFAEKVGLMPQVGDWVLQSACREALTWRNDAKVSVNLSPVQFRPNLVERVASVLATTGLPPRRLELELTETAMIDDTAGAMTMLHALRALGITIALDDFGTGYSSLSFLRTLPFDRIKIDRSFVQDLGTRPEAFAIVRALTELCGSLRVGITAEGVETDQQIELLRKAGCSEFQGFKIGRPAPSAELQAWMSAFATSRRSSNRQSTPDSKQALTKVR